VLTDADKSIAVQLNNLTRSLDRKIKFYWANCWGFYGFSFTDLGKGHTYMVEENQVVSSEVDLDGDGSGEPRTKKVKLTDVPEKQYVQKTLDYPSLDTALAVKAGKVNYGITKRVNPVFLLTHIMLTFHEQHGRFPNNRATDVALLNEMQKDIVEERIGLDESVTKKLTDLQWTDKVFGELAPIASIVGAVVGQDIIRAVSEKETPVKNFYVFNGIDCNGVVECFGK